MSIMGLAAKRRAIKAYNATLPLQMTEVPRKHWTAEMERMQATTDSPAVRAFRSRQFIAVVYQEPGKPLRLSVCRSTLNERGDYSDNITWVDLQRVKSECGYGCVDAVEIYPADADVVNVANMRHLWLLDEPSPLTWREQPARAAGGEGT